jgi:hypothetical protein
MNSISIVIKFISNQDIYLACQPCDFMPLAQQVNGK